MAAWKAGNGAYIKAVAAIYIICLPGSVGGFEDHIGRTFIVSYYKSNMACTVVVRAGEFGNVKPRDGIGRNGPGSRDGPVAAVHQARSRLCNACRLIHTGKIAEINNHAGAVALVVTQAINLDVEGGSRPGNIHFEFSGSPFVVAHIGGKALNRQVACAADIPFRFRRAGKQVFLYDRILPRYLPHQ